MFGNFFFQDNEPKNEIEIGLGNRYLNERKGAPSIVFPQINLQFSFLY